MSGVKNFGLIWDIEHTHKIYGELPDITAALDGFVKIMNEISVSKNQEVSL